MKEHPYIEELGRFTAYMRTNLPYARTRRFARNTPYTAVSPSESPLRFAGRRDESVIVGYYTSAEVPSPRRRQPGAPLGELSVRRIHIAHRRCEQGFQGAQHPLAQNAHPTDLSLKSIGKPLQIGAFTKRNWTPASILIVSKLVSSYGGPDRIRTDDPHNANVMRSQLRYRPRYPIMPAISGADLIIISEFQNL